MQMQSMKLNGKLILPAAKPKVFLPVFLLRSSLSYRLQGMADRIQTRSRKYTTVQSSSTISLTGDSTSPPVSNSSKIPFPPRKIRKLTSKPLLPQKSASSTSTSGGIIPVPAAVVAITKPLSFHGEIELALNHLRRSDPLLSSLIDSFTPPTFDAAFSPFFHALSRSILSQQLSPSAANTIYSRFVSLHDGVPNILPQTTLSITPEQLRAIGVSGRKASYLHDLASRFLNGTLSDEDILKMDDQTLLEKLTLVKGIGNWTVHMFMIFTLHRPDVLPVGDLGVRKGVKMLYKLKDLPKPEAMEEICCKWKPYRYVGSWYMWRLVEAKGVV